MCTVTFVPTRSGFYLAMNRDEKKSRTLALPPESRLLGAGTALYPREPGGGTWIGLNDRGLALALMNWDESSWSPSRKKITRGNIIPKLLAASSWTELQSQAAHMSLACYMPFRLLLISPAERRLVELRWNGQRHEIEHGWKRNHWFSSGYDELAARKIRQKVVLRQAQQASVNRPDWIRRLHRSHAPDKGPFSICMHRDDAETVSYTEIRFLPLRASMLYQPGVPCADREVVTRALTMVPSAPPQNQDAL